MHHPPAEIVTPRLVLRRSRPSDTAARFAFGRDPEVGRYMDWAVLTDIGQLDGAAERNAAKWNSGEEYAWLITLPDTDQPIGNISCRIDGHSADFGYLLSTDHWGHGYATEAAQAVFDWLAGLPEIVRIWATCDTDNAASIRILEKLAMTREATLRRWAIRPNLAPGVPRDAHMYVWIRED
ncbi:MAG: hypothetical protein JWO82_2134 [Akkermansiaceae bacterium]|nr:hypothetical protein [Akkermansiaceae bacterium]